MMCIKVFEGNLDVYDVKSTVMEVAGEVVGWRERERERGEVENKRKCMVDK